MDMRNVENLIINKAIIHILNNKEQNPVLIDYPIELTSEIVSLLKKHIKNSINDENTRIAKFDGTFNVVKGNSESIFNAEVNFVKASKEIAKLLFQTMKQNTIISAANFTVCIYSVDSVKYIALLKLDFSKLIQTKVEILADGKKKMKVVVSSDGIPNSKQKLQKCVFISKYDENNEYDIILLDKQAAKDKKDELVAKFFAFSFLNCILTKTDKDNTRLFKAYTQRFIEENLDDNIEKSDDIRKHMFTALKSQNKINIVTFAEDVFGDNNEIKEKYTSYMSETVGDFNFNIDKNWVRDNLRRKKYKTDNNIEINIDYETANDVDKFSIEKHTQDDKVDIIIKNVKYTEQITK